MSLKLLNFSVNCWRFVYIVISKIKIYLFGSKKLPNGQIRHYFVNIGILFFFCPSVHTIKYLLAVPSRVNCPLSKALGTHAVLTVCLCFSQITQCAWKEAAPIVLSRVFWQREFPPCIKLQIVFQIKLSLLLVARRPRCWKETSFVTKALETSHVRQCKTIFLVL